MHRAHTALTAAPVFSSGSSSVVDFLFFFRTRPPSCSSLDDDAVSCSSPTWLTCFAHPPWREWHWRPPPTLTPMLPWMTWSPHPHPYSHHHLMHIHAPLPSSTPLPASVSASTSTSTSTTHLRLHPRPHAVLGRPRGPNPLRWQQHPRIFFTALLVGCVVALPVPPSASRIPRIVGTHRAHPYKVAEHVYHVQRAETLVHDEQTVSFAAYTQDPPPLPLVSPSSPSFSPSSPHAHWQDPDLHTRTASAPSRAAVGVGGAEGFLFYCGGLDADGDGDTLPRFWI
ncbi:hypothetical protein B0H11DRAFT_2259930 [Mycena galericulata]|nr:hypothetical protein B0H11DRAFT_2259930 [Mycena galericulata]